MVEFLSLGKNHALQQLEASRSAWRCDSVSSRVFSYASLSYGSGLGLWEFLALLVI